MRYRVLLMLIILLLLAAVVRGQTTAPPGPPTDTRAADLLVELGKATYAAKRAIPASDGIFVEGATVMEPLYALAREEHGIIVRAGQTASPSKVLLLDRALQVFFAGDQCALIIIPKGDRLVANMPLSQLIEVARKGIAALFVSKPEIEKTRPPT